MQNLQNINQVGTMPHAFLATIDEAYDWLCKARLEYSHNSDIWQLRRHWPIERELILSELNNAAFKFDPTTRYHFEDELRIVFAARDSLVLKMLAIYLKTILAPNLPQSCFHLPGRGGIKAAINAVRDQAPDYNFIIKTDILSFYGSIQFAPLMKIVREQIPVDSICDLIEQSLPRTDYDGGDYIDIEQSLPMGSPLSPILGALMLLPLSNYFDAKSNVYYCSFMDDFIIMCKGKSQQKRMLKKLYQLLDPLQLELHPDKTFIGRITKGFDFLGYHFKEQELTPAKKTLDNFKAKISKLLERGASRERIGRYCKRFRQWLVAAVELVIPHELNEILEFYSGCLAA